MASFLSSPGAAIAGGLSNTKRALTPPGLPEAATSTSITALGPPSDPGAARSALDAADVARRRQLAVSGMATSNLGLSGDAPVKRSVLG